MFTDLTSSSVPRRAFLFMPFAFAGLVAVTSRKEHPIPDASSGGSGPTVKLVLFSDAGERTGQAEVNRVVKTDAEWRQELTAAEFAVTRQSGTERAYAGRYWNQHANGIYRCVCCGNALFRSAEKFESGTGWPSFWAPAADENVARWSDVSLMMERVEVRCVKCGAHLGHVFADGPAPTGMRYCINSVSLRFVPAA